MFINILRFFRQKNILTINIVLKKEKDKRFLLHILIFVSLSYKENTKNINTILIIFLFEIGVEVIYRGEHSTGLVQTKPNPSNTKIKFKISFWTKQSELCKSKSKSNHNLRFGSVWVQVKPFYFLIWNIKYK